MENNYLNSRNILILATYFAESFNSHDVAKFAIEEWFLAEGLNSRNGAKRFEKHFMKSNDVCRPDEYEYGNRITGYTLNASIVDFFDKYISPVYQDIKKYVYEEMDIILQMYACNTKDQLLNDLMAEFKPYRPDMNQIIEHIFKNYILKSDYREKNKRFFEKFNLNWLNEQNFKFTIN